MRLIETYIGLADCNNFFVSCERSVNPDLEGKPVVVLSNNDGCVVARSNESKRMGVRMGQPAFELKDEIRRGSLIALSGNHLLYREISLKVHDIFRRYVPVTIDYSIDEAFLDVSGIPAGEIFAIGDAIVNACRREAHVPVTVGFSLSKTLAKLACEWAKKRGECVNVMLTEDAVAPLLDSLPISELWGVGRRLSRRMYESGVHTIGDFIRSPREWVRSRFGVNGERSWLELHGRSCIDLSHVDRLLQESVSETRTFPSDVDDYDYLRSRIAIYAADCAKKLRGMRGVCNKVTVMLRSNRFHPESVYLAPEASAELSSPTSDTVTIVECAIRLLETIYKPGAMYKRGGVLLSGISKDVPRTPSLFGSMDLDASGEEHSGGKSDTESVDDSVADRKRCQARLMRVLDGINGRVGNNVIRLASELVKTHPGHNDGYSSSFGAPFNPPEIPEE